jgi:hypothetical protein
MARIVAKREKDQRTEYDQLNDIADIHDDAFSPFSLISEGFRNPTPDMSVMLALRIGLHRWS